MVSEYTKSQFEKGMQLKERGSYELARKVFVELINSEPNSAKIRAVLADTYWREGDLEMAIRHFLRATELAPEWELASLGLFHCLWEQGDKDDAFEEMKRFMAIADSEDYKEIVKEIIESSEEIEKGSN